MGAQLSIPHVRLAAPTDAPALARLRWDFSLELDQHAATRQTFAAFADAFTAFVRAALSTDAWVIWVAELDGQIVAHAYVEFVPTVPQPGEFTGRWAYVTNVYTTPSVRGKGVGAHLMRRLTEWAQTQDLRRLVLWPTQRSVPFYTRAGFTPSETAMEFPCTAKPRGETVRIDGVLQ